MNGLRAKKLRWLAKYRIKDTRSLSNDEKYHVEQHEKYIGMKNGKPVKIITLQLWNRGPKVLYKHYKNQYYKTRQKRRY